MSESTLLLVALGVLASGAIELTEAVGLWLMRRWGEYVAAVGTGVFVPLEVYELWRGLSRASGRCRRRGSSC